MDSKITSALEKALQDKRKGNFDKALRRISDALSKYPDEVELYIEAADVCLEGGESLQGAQYLKKAYTRFAAEKGRIDAYALEKLRSTGDPVLSKFLLNQAIKRRDLDAASDVLADLQDRLIRELLQRTRIKKQTLNSAARGGHALKSELVINLISEALLCLRLGRMKESVRAFLEVLDDKPVENEVLEPFFSGLEKKYSKVGRIRYAYACSLIATQQYEKAMMRFVQGVKLEPKIADDALTRIRDLIDKFETPPDSIQDALVEILLVKGDILRASEILQESLAENPDNAQKVLELIRPYAEADSETLLLHYLYMDAALAADLPRRVLESLKKLCRNDTLSDDVYQWLNTKSKEQFLPTDVMLFHGQLALVKSEFEHGMEILRAVIASSPNETTAVLTVVKKHKKADSAVKEFFEELAASQQSPGARSGGDSEFEHFENTEFSFSSGTSREAENEESADEKQAEEGAEEEPEVEAEDEVAVEEENSGSEGPFAGETSILDNSSKSTDPFADEEEHEEEHDEDGQKSPLETGLEEAARQAVATGADIVWEEEDASGEIDVPDEQVDNSWLETRNDKVMSPAFGSGNRVEAEVTPEPEEPEQAPEEVEEVEEKVEEKEAEPEKPEESEESEEPEEPEEPDEPEEPEEPEAREEPEDIGENPEEPPAETNYSIDADRVVQLADALRRAGARMFFHIDDKEPADSVNESANEEKAKPAEDMEATTDENVEDVHPAESYDQQFERFLGGNMDNNSAMDLASEALARGRLDEVRELLHITPSGQNEKSRRKRLLAEYYMAADRPGTALEILVTLRPGSLDSEEKQSVLKIKAQCQKLTNDLEGSYKTYLQIKKEYPSAENDVIAKRSYERYLNSQCHDALVLEKTTSLNGE